MNGALAGLAILAIGDSHMVYMASPLHEALEQQGAIVNTYGMCGAMATDWLTISTTQCSVERHANGPAVLKYTTSKGWLLSDLIAKNNPNLVVVELGDNMAGYGTMAALPRDFIADQVRQFLAPIKARNLPCIWIGPPWGSQTTLYHKTDARLKELSQFLSQTVAPCSYVDTTAFAQPGQWATLDGEHLTQPAYHQWSQEITGAIVRLRAHLH
jgi:lysophospholipase L1-like esterase